MFRNYWVDHGGISLYETEPGKRYQSARRCEDGNSVKFVMYHRFIKKLQLRLLSKADGEGKED